MITSEGHWLTLAPHIYGYIEAESDLIALLVSAFATGMESCHIQSSSDEVMRFDHVRGVVKLVIWDSEFVSRPQIEWAALVYVVKCSK